MKRLTLILFLLTVVARADSLDVGSDAVISTNSQYLIPIPRDHEVFNHADSLERWVIHGQYMFHTDDAWATKDSVRVAGFNQDGHETIAIITIDSVLTISGGNYTAEFLGSTGRFPPQAGPTGFYRGVLFGDTVNTVYWNLFRGSGSSNFDYNFAYSTSSDAGDTWSTIRWIDSLAHDGRINVMKYPSGYPAAVIMDFTDGLVKYRYATSLTSFSVNADSMINSSMSWSANERVFDCGMYILSDGDTATFLLNARDSTIVLFWKSFNGGSGSYNIDTLYQNYNSTWSEMAVTVGQIFDMVIFAWIADTSGSNQRVAYMSWWDVAGDTISTPKIISASGDVNISGLTIAQYNPFHTGEAIYLDDGATQLVRIPLTLIEVSAGGGDISYTRRRKMITEVIK